MRIRLRLNLGADWPEPWRQDEVVDAPDSLASKLLAAGLADRVKAEPVAVHVASSEPAVEPVAESTAEPSHADAPRRRGRPRKTEE